MKKKQEWEAIPAKPLLTWILPLMPFLDQICQQFMQAVFMICVVGGNLSNGAAIYYPEQISTRFLVHCKKNK